MRKVKVFAVLALVAMTAGAAVAQETKPTPSRVAAATVFLRGAEITHTASLTLEKGAGEVSIEGLSPDIDRNSLRINIGGGVVVSAHEFSTDYLSSTKAPSARLKMLKDSIDIYQARLDKTDVDIEINSGMQGYLDTGIAKNVSGSEAGLGIDELKKTMDYYQAKSEEILNGARELRKRRGELTTALVRVRNQYNEESGAGGKTSGVLRLSLSAPAAGNFPVTITYYTPSASWSPYYDINAASTDRPITIAARSRVRQTTGLDWENVRLTLSTATPSNGRVAPLFSTWFLREKPSVDDVVVVGYGTQRNSRITGALAGKAAGIAAPAAQNTISYDSEEFSEDMVEEVTIYTEQAIYDHVTTADNALNVTYDIDLPYTIPGNGKEQSIDLATKETPAEFKYYSAPKLDGATYLIAEISNWESLGLLSAPANITYDGTYIGETRIDASATQEKLTLTLGTDRRVSVTRELAREFSQTRAIGGATEQTFTYRITVRNGRTEPVTMVLKDQYPTSTDKNITVTLDTKATTPPTVDRTDLGVVTWEGSLAAGETRVYTLSYAVKYPRDMRIDM